MREPFGQTYRLIIGDGQVIQFTLPGSTKRTGEIRRQEQIGQLRRKQHHNKELQWWWDAYSTPGHELPIRVEVVNPLCPVQRLRIEEQRLIDEDKRKGLALNSKK